MAEHGLRQRLHIIRERIVAALQRGSGAGGGEQPQASARAGSHLAQWVAARLIEQSNDVFQQRIGGAHQVDGLLGLHELVECGDGRGTHLGAAAQQLGLGLTIGVPERDAREEAIQLRWRERVGAVKSCGRILRGDHHERRVDAVGRPVHRHLQLLHHLKQARLRLRRRAVELVDEQHVGEDRPGVKLKALRAGVPDGGAQEIGRQQIDGGLHARKAGGKAAADAAGQLRFADAWLILD